TGRIYDRSRLEEPKITNHLLDSREESIYGLLALDQSNRADRAVANVFVRIANQVPERIERRLCGTAQCRKRIDRREAHVTVGIAKRADQRRDAPRVGRPRVGEEAR